MNNLLILLDLESWKPVLTALLLPPVPLLLLILVGARLMLPWRGLGWLLIITGVALMWLCSCVGTGRFLGEMVLRTPPVLSLPRVAELKSEVRDRAHIAVVVLGGGQEPLAPEYGVSSLTANSLARLRYGLWLSRETGAPVAFSGGIGWAQGGEGIPEAQIASRIASQEFGRPIKWLEAQSRDTHENAIRTVALLKSAGIDHVVLVTHGWHMPRSKRAFEQAAGANMRIEAAPIGLIGRGAPSNLTWLPSSTGLMLVRDVLRELAGLAFGA